MNTKFSYLYQDAGNFKTFGAVIFAGEADPGLAEAILSNLGDGEGFLPGDVGIPSLISGTPDPEMDDPWHALAQRRADDPGSFLAPTNAEPTDPRTIAEFAQAFAKAQWNEAEAMKELFGEDLPDWYCR
jgi:hypothetical protein